MKKINILIVGVLVACAFGRISNKHDVSVSPYGLSYNSQKGEIHVGIDEDDSLKWKRRHKKRKKTRRPQRGR